MLIIIQYTITDIRKFVSIDNDFIPYPNWPLPDQNEFLKSAGSINQRRLGGLDNWIGEPNICFAKRSIKINKWLSFTKSKPYDIRLKFRRFYFDGYASGRYEIGFIIYSKRLMIDIKKLIQELFCLNVRIPLANDSEKKVLLGNANKSLKLQYLSSTSKDILSNTNYDKYVTCSGPNVVLECHKDENIAFNTKSQIEDDNIYYDFQSDFSVSHFNLSIQGKKSSLWLIRKDGKSYHLNNEFGASRREISKSFNNKYKSATNSQYSFEKKIINDNLKIRDVRIVLSRLHSDRLSLSLILKNVELNKINPKPFSPESELLQRYLLNVLKKVLKNENYKHLDSLTLKVRFIEDRIIPGRNDALYEKLRMTICIRPQILQKVKEYYELIENKEFVEQTNTTLIMKKNVFNISESSNVNLNLAEGDINQSLSDSFKIIDISSKENLLKKVDEIGIQLNSIQNEVLKEDYSNLVQDLFLMKEELGKEKATESRFKSYTNNLLETLKKIGDVSIPIVKMVGDILALF